MIKFSIDYFEPSTFFQYFDYSNKIILNAVSDPLFIYDKNTNKYVLNACESYEIIGKKYELKLRDDLFYYDGNKVTVNDFVNTIQEQRTILPEIYSNILSVKNIDDKIVIELKENDNSFINKLSLYLFSPHNNRTCGRYYINKISRDQIELLPNKFYRIKSNKKLIYTKLESLEKNIEYFKNRKIDITNNTFFNLKNGNIKNEKSGIIFSIEISSRIPKTIRKKIVNSINKNTVVKKLGDSYFVKNDFFFNEISEYKNKKIINKEKIYLKLYYNKFYPNKEIALLIKQELENNNYEICLIESEYNEFKTISNYDIKLTLNYFEYIDDLYFYNSRYFNYIMRNNFLYSFLLRKGIMKRQIHRIFKKMYLKEPIISFYSSYETNDKTKGFSFIECDYKKIN